MAENSNPLCQWREDCGLSFIGLMNVSSVPTSYLIKLENGGIKKPGRENLLAVALGLDLTFEQIDELFEYYNLRQLECCDAALFVDVAKKQGKQALAGVDISVMRQGIGLIVSTLAMEIMSLDTESFLVTGQPYLPLFSSELYKNLYQKFFFYKCGSRYRDLLNEIIILIHQERNRLFTEKIQHVQVRHYICGECLKKHVGRIKIKIAKSQTKSVIIESYLACIEYALKHDLYQMFLTDRCTPSDIHFLPDKGVVASLSRSEHGTDHSLLLSNNSGVISAYRKVVSGFQNNCITETNEEIMDYISKLFKS